MKHWFVFLFGSFVGFLASRLTFVEAFSDSIKPYDSYLFGGIFLVLNFIFLFLSRNENE